ncbi:MAG: hypothetical protein ACREMR_07380, partial [Gemmatimonadales bacterium]
LTLAVGEYVSIDPAPVSGCTVFPATAGVNVEYLLVTQSATGTPGKQASFTLTGARLTPLAAASLASPALSDVERFHGRLREWERKRWYGSAPASTGPALRVASGPPRVGDTLQFSVCADLNCARFDRVRAAARSVGSHLAIFVDVTAPAPPKGLDSADLAAITALFDTLLYAVDTAAFGRESDINGDALVLLLMTPTVNRLVTRQQCNEQGFVAGFFLGADLDPGFASDGRFNHSEIFYTFVADPDSTASCAHTRAFVRAQVPVTVIHELQHMLSFNQHVLLRSGNPEVLWLNEGLSHFAEELGGRRIPLGEPTRRNYFTGDWLNAYRYLDSTFAHFLLPTEGIGTLAERGAQWLYVRFLVDQYAGDTTVAAWNAFTRQLVATTRTGAANVDAVTGGEYTLSVTRWALANWVSDLDSVVPGFVPPPELRYTSWSLRALYDSLHTARINVFPKPFPLTPPVDVGQAVSLSGTLHAGSGSYQRVVQASPDSGFTLLFSEGNGSALPAGVAPRLNVIRIR